MSDEPFLTPQDALGRIIRGRTKRYKCVAYTQHMKNMQARTSVSNRRSISICSSLDRRQITLIVR
jgi:hypothetical protein